MRRSAALFLILLGTLWGTGGATAQAPPTVPHFFFGTGTEVTLDGVTYTESPVVLVATTPAGDSLAEVQVDLPVRRWTLNVPVGVGETEILFELANSRDRDTVLGTTEPFAIEAGGLTEVKALDFVSGPRFRDAGEVTGVAGRGQLLDAQSNSDWCQANGCQASAAGAWIHKSRLQGTSHMDGFTQLSLYKNT